MTTLRDPIHGDLVFEGVLAELIYTEEFQRLSEVKQLGLTDKVFPGANHTRLSHSLGVSHLAGEMAQRLSVPPKDRLLLQVAALLHDIGHYDFSHALEALAPCNHEENGRLIIMGEQALPLRKHGQIASLLRTHGISPEDIVALLHREGSWPQHYHSILSGPVIDADRMDYLKRDSYYSGAVIGEIDISRLLNTLVVHPQTGELGILEKGVASLQQFLLARLHMHRQVYLHQTAHVGETMLRKAVLASIDEAMPLLYGDNHLIARLMERGSPLTKELIGRIRAGRKSFYVPAFTVDVTGKHRDLLDAVKRVRAEERGSPGAAERALLQLADLRPGELLVSFPASQERARPLPRFPVLTEEGEWAELFSISPLAKEIFEEEVSDLVFGAWTVPAHAARVRTAAEAYLNDHR